jgi:phasin family protein
MERTAAKRGSKSKRGTRPQSGTARTSKRRAKPRARSGSAAATAQSETVGSKAPLQKVRSALDFLKLPNIASAMVAARKKDLDAILEANKKSYAGVQTVVQRQTAALKDAVSEWQLATRVMAASGPRESISKLDELAIAAFKMALNNIRELAEMAVKSQADAYEVVTTRIRENIDEVSSLLERA